MSLFGQVWGFKPSFHCSWLDSLLPLRYDILLVLMSNQFSICASPVADAWSETTDDWKGTPFTKTLAVGHE